MVLHDRWSLTAVVSHEWFCCTLQQAHSSQEHEEGDLFWRFILVHCQSRFPIDSCRFARVVQPAVRDKG